MVNSSITIILSGEFPKIQPEHLRSILDLHEEQASVSFIARYRADAVGGLDEPRISAVIERYNELCVLWARKRFILNEMENNGVTSPELAAKVEACLDRFELEDLYLPFRPRNRTKATTADEQGLKPLAEVFWDQQVDAPPEELAAPYINPENKVETAQDALDGAIHIMSEWIAFNPTARKNIRNFIFDTGLYQSKLVPERQGQTGKYETYYDFSEPIRTIPSHRVLAIRRGVKEHWLQTSVVIDTQAALEILHKQFVVNPDCRAKEIVERAIVLAFDKLMWKTISNEIAGIIGERADRDAIDVFCKNLRNLLLSPPAGNVPVVAIEPSTRPDAHAAAIDAEGNLLESMAIITNPGDPQHEESTAAFAQFVEKHTPAAIVIGNGPESRTADEFARQFLKNRTGESKIARAVVNESGANIYATSKLAREELPDTEPSVRCAVTIGRRFQDPLAELVKIDPRAIGVGQYQHDVDQRRLIEKLRSIIRCCVNYVGADAQKAPSCMLSYVSGFNRGTAKRIAEYRNAHERLQNLEELKTIPAVNEKVFNQAAGFLRLKESTEPLDDTAIHPGHYELARQIAADHGIDLAQPDGDRSALKQVEIEKYISEHAGPLAIKLILRELRKPRREVRRRVDLAEIANSITSIDDLKEGQMLEGTVTNVTNFGAFVDIGVHQDGLVHVSELSRSYVRDPNDAVKIGEVVRVKVLQVERERQRISLSIKQAAKPAHRKPAQKKTRPAQKKQQPQQQTGNRPVTQDDIQKLIDKLATR